VEIIQRLNTKEKIPLPPESTWGKYIQSDTYLHLNQHAMQINY